MPVKFSTRPDGVQVIEVPTGETITLLTQSELARHAGRSPAFVANRVSDGTVTPIARTESGISLFSTTAVFALLRNPTR